MNAQPGPDAGGARNGADRTPQVRGALVGLAVIALIAIGGLIYVNAQRSAERERLQSDLGELRSTVAEVRTERERLEADLEALRGDLAEERDALGEQLQETTATLEALRAEQNQRRDEIDRLSAEIGELRQTRDRLQAEIAVLEEQQPSPASDEAQ